METNEPKEALLYDRVAAAHALGISTASLDSLIKAGRIPTVKLGRRVFVHLDTLKKIAAEGLQGRMTPAAVK